MKVVRRVLPGQTTILTGINAPKFLGYHKQDFTNEKLREVINENPYFFNCAAAGSMKLFLPTLTRRSFFRKSSAGNLRRPAPSKLLEFSFGICLIRPDEKPLFRNFLKRGLPERGYDVPLYSPMYAAKKAQISTEYRVTLYDQICPRRRGQKSL